MKFSTYALTFRPKDGITDEQIDKLHEWIRKRSKYYHIVTEKTGSAKHLHAGLVLRVPVTRSNISVLLTRLFQGLNNEERRVWLNGIKIMYNKDFIDNYLEKDDDTVVIASSLPENGCLDSYFPPKPASVQRTRKCSAYYHELETLYWQHVEVGTDVNTMNIRNFLFKMMYSERCIPVIKDDKTIIQTARHLVRWIKKEEYSTIVIPPFEREE